MPTDSKDTANVLHDNFAFYTALLENQVTYLQTIEGCSQAVVKEITDTLINELNVQHGFGAIFAQQIHKFIAQSYLKSTADIVIDVANQSGIDDAEVASWLNKVSAGKLGKLLSPRFRVAINN